MTDNLTNDHDDTDSVSKKTAENYFIYVHRRSLLLLAMGLLLAGLSIFTLRLGSTGLSYSEIITYLFHPDGSWDSTVVWDIRLPRIVGAILVGAALGLAGAVMQNILRNPLASPFTLGVSNAAAFGAAVGILVVNGAVITQLSSIDDPIVITLFAFAFAMIATGIMLVLVKMTDCSPETIVLAGLAISSIFSSLLAFSQYMADDVQLAAIVYWQFGSLSKITWSNLYIIFAVLAVSFVYFFIKRWDYNVMEAGEDVAKGLGIKTDGTRTIGLIISSVLTATVVSFTGVIGFIGLLAPHVIKRVIGNDNRFVLIGSVLIGALVLVLAYIVGTFAFDTVIPVGIITSAIGGPIFIAILLKGWRKGRCSA